MCRRWERLVAWSTAERVRRAQQLLEDTDLPVEQVAKRCGPGTAANLRIHFARRTGTTPTAYQATFTTGTATSVVDVEDRPIAPSPGRIRATGAVPDGGTTWRSAGWTTS